LAISIDLAIHNTNKSSQEKCMHPVRVRKMFQFAVVLFMVVLGTSGCFKANISADVKANGSGILGIAFGMNQQAKTLLSSQGGDPFQNLQDQMAKEGGQSLKDFQVTRWQDGDYDWMKAEREFSNLEELNTLMGKNEMFSRFSLVRNKGFLQDEFILDAELNKLNDSTASNPAAFNIDLSTLLDIKFSTRLPGKIVETNGYADAADPNRLSWNAQGNQAVPIQARAVAWNWLVILILLLLIGLSLLVIAGLAFLVYKGSRKKQPDQDGQASLPTS
jgi:hypothetical protein